MGTGYFDQVAEAIAGGQASTLALEGSTEAAQFTQADRLTAAHQVMESDHRELGAFVERVKAARDLTALTRALDLLGAFLATHFEREERDQGVFGILANRGASDEVDGFLAEHRRILEEVKGLAEGARDGLGDSQVAARSARLVHQLRDHELREHAMAEKALGSTARRT